MPTHVVHLPHFDLVHTWKEADNDDQLKTLDRGNKEMIGDKKLEWEGPKHYREVQYSSERYSLVKQVRKAKPWNSSAKVRQGKTL